MERSAVNDTLQAAAHAVAHGGELDNKLDSLAEQARSAAGATATVIYVLDPLNSTLVPAASSGAAGGVLGEAGAIALDDEQELVARVVRERRAASVTDGSASARAFGEGAHAGLVALPLVYADESGTEDAEGALLASFDGAPPDSSAPAGPLAALADLCAVAIRQARLEHTLVERAEWIDRVASTDALTGLPNRTMFERMLELELARAVRAQVELSVVLFDIDGLTEINERVGAHVGDDLLRGVASLLAEQVRLVDSIARVGPDEFGLVAPTGGGGVVARRVRDRAATLPSVEGAELSLSVAVVVFPHDGGSSAELMAAANATLQQAKAQGRGSVLVTREA